jgi:antagonist of KipI
MSDKMPGIHIESPGLLSTIQDLGRFGYQRYGMPVSGAMDSHCLRLANLLVGNAPDAAGIEATLMGPTLRFSAGTRVALCGAGMQGMINDSQVPCYQALEVKGGDLLHFVGQESGCRMYIAFAGGVDVPLVMGSRSTYLRAGIGGHEGRALRKGDVLPLGNAVPPAEPPTALPEQIPDYLSNAPIRIIPGPEVSRLASKGVISLLTSEYQVSGHSDRMGYRLEGEPIGLNTPSADIISAGIAMGTIQVPGNGQPIILMADRQTTGGYVRAAVVASVDLGRVAQLRPGDTVTFAEISPEEARRLCRW